MSRIAENLASVKERIKQACLRSGRDEDSVKLIAVTKTVGEDEIRELYSLGVRDFGENRVEVITEKFSILADLTDVNWHFIGHLQRNKAKKVVGKVAAIHSVESEGLLKLIASSEIKPQVFIEVSISGEENKYGLAPNEATGMISDFYESVDIVGLMTMAPFYSQAEQTRSVFEGLRLLRDKVQSSINIELPALSMGMSNDFEVAIEEGATHVRVGSELFK